MKRIGRGLRHGLFLLPAIIAALLYVWLPHVPQLTEKVFSRGIFRAVSVPLGGLVAVLPFSLTECLVVLALPLAVTLGILLAKRLRRTEAKGRVLARAGKGLGWVLSSVLLLYMVMHGANFYRLPVSELMGLDTSIQSPAYLQRVCIDLAQKASAERELLEEDEDGYTKLSVSKAEILRLADNGYRKLDDTYPYLWGGVWRTKPVLLSHWWSYTGITGMYFPFFAEANVNIDVPDSDIPATAAHELAHTRGFAKEDDCNFFAYLTATHSDSADFRYSGYYLAFVYCYNALYRVDRDAASALWASACGEIKADAAASREHYEKVENEKVSEATYRVYDSYLKAFSVESGKQSYGEVVDLLTAWYYAKIKG